MLVLKKICSGLLTLAVLPLWAGFEVRAENGNYTLWHDGKMMLSAIESYSGKSWTPPPGTQKSEATLSDGSKVYQLWNENPDYKFRREIAVMANGTVEIKLTDRVQVLEKVLELLDRPQSGEGSDFLRALEDLGQEGGAGR